MKDELLLLKEILIKDPPNTEMAIAIINIWLDKEKEKTVTVKRIPCWQYVIALVLILAFGVASVAYLYYSSFSA